MILGIIIGGVIVAVVAVVLFVWIVNKIGWWG